MHLIGFVVPWRLADLTSGGFAYTTTVLAGRLDLGTTGVRIVDLLWLLAAVAFAIAAVGWLAEQPWSIAATTAATLPSLALCLLDGPRAYAGVLADVALLSVVLAGTRSGRFGAERMGGGWRRVERTRGGAESLRAPDVPSRPR